MCTVQPMKAKKGNRQRFRVLIVDNHPVSREGLVYLINHQSDMVVCAEAGNASQALDTVCGTRPDIVLLDVAFPDKNGLELIRDITAVQPGLPMLVVSMHDEAPYAERVLQAGARGYIAKHEGGERVIHAMRENLTGKFT